MKRLINSEYHDEIKIDELKGNFNRMSIEINKKEKLQQLEQEANLSTYPSKRFNSFCYDDDDDEDYAIAITPSLSTKEPDNSLSVNPLIDHHCCYKCGNLLNDFFCHQCTCEFCGNGVHVGYNCPAQVPSIQTLPSFPQQYPCCEDCRDLPKAYQCQPPQYTVNHPIFNAHNDLLNSQNKLIKQLTSMCNMVGQYIQRKEEEKRIEEEQAAKAQNWKLPVCYDDDDDEERSISLKDNIISGLPSCAAITPSLSTEELDNSLSMGDEHLDTVLVTESDEFIKSSVENLVLISSESEGIPDNMCNVPFHDNSLPLDVSKDQFKDSSDSNDESTSIDDDSFSIDNIEYAEASPPNSELVSLELMEIVIPKV
nr:hypothetical protein [Tanacetum cinerariifolium]